MARKATDYSKLTEKRCSHCKHIKRVDQFNWYRDASAPINGWRYYSWCRACQNEHSRSYGRENKPRRNRRLRNWRRRNLETARKKERRARYQARYGMTPEEADQMFEQQSHRCLICGRNDRLLVVDHCHATGRVRGGLCRNCNTFLATVENDRATLRRIEKYLDCDCHADLLLAIVRDPSAYI